MKVKINTEIDLACLFDAAHSQKEIHAMIEYLLPHASDESIANAVLNRNIIGMVVGKLTDEKKGELFEQLKKELWR